MRAVGVDPVHGTRETYRALLSAMSQPGTVESTPEPADYAVVVTLVDHEVGCWTDDDGLRSDLADQGRLDAVDQSEAAVVHARHHENVAVEDCRRGSLVEPSDGATVVYQVDALAEGAAADLTTVGLTGPGVDGTAALSVALPATELEAIAAAQSDYPRGVDAVFASDDAVAAIPRSVTMESLEVA
ncbi:phosphonate metabolism protein PhnH [Haloarcula rubripromontorii]|uniref:Phosphonate C-P lyase system protein PhnH n=1 Tax=Haloarcula rubripromontorii TaxID=1705562 RepID=A0A0N0U8M5_9EURY|nr:phosphonate C-P lyase system protein PhnH [Haloarcula rubripromontorii]KOX91433.1 phosphonate metabolism protein PhnH [Haloarcula rubripromontorii]NLV08324.1 phosphonate C-P lyase system protein PhnH [Haloarcula rubripromontorii]